VARVSLGVEILVSLLAWKLVIPEAISLNCENHETDAMNDLYGFSNELSEKSQGSRVRNSVRSLFNALLLGHVINAVRELRNAFERDADGIGPCSLGMDRRQRSKKPGIVKSII
jgi:hypothetical protein